MDRLACGLLELKFDDTGAKTRHFTGHGAVFKNVDAYGDVIDPGAFSAWLADVKAGKQEWPAMMSQHGGWGMTAEDLTPVGAWTDLGEDGTGLKVEGDLADTPRGNELHVLMKMEPRPAINGLSIGYIPKEWEPRSKPEEPKRRLKRIDVVEISPVTFPANRRARVTGVKAGGLSERDFERLLMQDAGLSRSEARVVMNHGFKSLLAMRDAGGDESKELASSPRRSRRDTRGCAAPHDPLSQSGDPEHDPQHQPEPHGDRLIIGVAALAYFGAIPHESLAALGAMPFSWATPRSRRGRSCSTSRAAPGRNTRRRTTSSSRTRPRARPSRTSRRRSRASTMRSPSSPSRRRRSRTRCSRCSAKAVNGGEKGAPTWQSRPSRSTTTVALCARGRHAVGHHGR
jgi:HK97 family phage prohead protease